MSCVLITERKRRVSSSTKNMATNQDKLSQGHPSQVQGNQDQHDQGLRTEYQRLRAENQELKARMGMVEAQMVEMRGILLTLKNGCTNEGATAAVARANPESVSSATTEPVQLTFAENNERAGVHHVQVPDSVAIPKIPLAFDSPAIAKSRVQGQIPENTIHSRDPHVNPALVSVIHLHEGVNGFLQNHSVATPQAKDDYQLLEELLRTIKGSMEAHDSNLVPNVVSPPASEVSDLVKFEGMTCPAVHTTMYCKEMLPLTKDDRLLTYCFRSSLAGEALSWYMHKHSHTRCWKKLADAFLERFNYNIGKTPSRAQLQNMAQRGKETFREYARRWNSLAAQVTPPLIEKEKVDIFMNTLPPLYYDKLVENASSSLGDLVLAGESLEKMMRSGELADSSTKATPIAGSGNVSDGPKIIPQILHSPTQARKSQNTPSYAGTKSGQFDPIPMSYSDLFDLLARHGLISVRLMKPYKPPFPRNYDQKATCKFHAGAVGHSIENCKALKHVVQELIDSKWLNFDDGIPKRGC